MAGLPAGPKNHDWITTLQSVKDTRHTLESDIASLNLVRDDNGLKEVLM